MYCSVKCNLVVKYENVLSVVFNLTNTQTSSSSRKKNNKILKSHAHQFHVSGASAS